MRPTVESSVIGTLTQDEQWADWWEGGPVAVPFFGGQPLPVAWRGFVPSADPTFLAGADAALRAFLAQGSAGRSAATPAVYANYLEMLDASDIESLGVPTPEAIWEYVFPQELSVERRSRRDCDLYLTVGCGCAWEEEHGLQLVYRRGEKLTRVSPQDGHLTEADACDLPDEDDPLLSAF